MRYDCSWPLSDTRHADSNVRSRGEADARHRRAYDRAGSNSADGFNRLGNGYDRLASYVLAWKVSR
jgi:hypothetical protein